jgi:predicted RNase H-like nuclease
MTLHVAGTEPGFVEDEDDIHVFIYVDVDITMKKVVEGGRGILSVTLPVLITNRDSGIFSKDPEGTKFYLVQEQFQQALQNNGAIAGKTGKSSICIPASNIAYITK